MASAPGNSNAGEKEGQAVEGRPVIHNIGTRAILAFEPDQDLEIPIEGQDLISPHFCITPIVQSLTSLKEGTDYQLVKVSSSMAKIVIKGTATHLFAAKDPITVVLTISMESETDAERQARKQLTDLFIPTLTAEQRMQITNGTIDVNTARSLGSIANLARASNEELYSLKRLIQRSKSAQADELMEAFRDAVLAPGEQTPIGVVKPKDVQLAADSRTFILYTKEAYRTDILAHQLEVQNITAFPLPQKEAAQLFGDFAADNYYAIRLTLTNPTDKDQLVSLGMIKAYGRALVTPPEDVGKPFTKSIDVAPQSQQQVYAMILDNKPYRKREWIFRTLDLVGALASAAGPAYKASADFTRATALYAGTALPGAKTLWPDPVVFYLANVMNFAMPDLVKVPKGGSIDGKYLFFSKGQLQAVLQDPTLSYAKAKLNKINKDTKLDFSAPVVFLSFDTLQVPFENTTIGAAPAAPSQVKAAAVGTTVKLSWAGVTGAASYTVLKSSTKGGPYATVQELIPSTQSTCEDANAMSPGASVYYIVRSVSPDGPSTNSTEVAVANLAPSPAAHSAKESVN